MIKIKSYLKALTPSVRKPAVIPRFIYSLLSLLFLLNLVDIEYLENQYFFLNSLSYFLTLNFVHLCYC